MVRISVRYTCMVHLCRVFPFLFRVSFRPVPSGKAEENIGTKASIFSRPSYPCRSSWTMRHARRMGRRFCLSSIQPTFQREMDWRKMDQNTFVETGCQGTMPYELRIPRDEITIGYRWRQHRRGNHQELSINWKQYRAVINLDSSRYLANLARFAPQQMQVYVNDLLRNGKPVPVALR